MGYRGRDWGERPPRPKVAKLSREALERLHARAVKQVAESVILCELVSHVQLARGRLYLWCEPEDLMARITPLSDRKMLLEAPRGSSWTEAGRGMLKTMLKALESDRLGTFHGLGVLARPDRDKDPAAQEVLHRELGIPIRVLAEPRYWYAMHRAPVIVEINEAKDRALVEFVASTFTGSFGGTCLYARRDGVWGCYVVRPNASDSIATAEAWLVKRDWESWG
jgi:hypothetical protein